MHLEKINSPADLRALDGSQLTELCEEMREFVVQAVSRVGGHLGSNLGAVELTVAIHRVFESPRDVIIWDTGHQAYVHKLLTGRQAEFGQLRQRHGLSGYPSASESTHDIVENSHASTSLSWASGLATGFDLTGHEHRRVVAVIGDGSMTGGMAFEALNNLGHYGQRAVIIMNDNGRSYAPTVSRLSGAVSKLRQSPNWVKGRRRFTSMLGKVPLGGEVKRGLSGAAAAMRDMWEPPAFFETLGVRYLGPVDGHDIPAVEQALRDAAAYEDGPIVVHMLTEKGRGYAPAEADEEKHLHDTGLFDPATGSAPSSSGASYTRAFTDAIVSAAADHPELVAITAAMPGSTGLIPFQDKYPERFFDVGIAEQHALTSAAGMAQAGLRPVVAIYSTFLARAFDQALYDIGLHRLPVILCIDRAGVTGPDGASHHGVYDMAMYSRVPGMTIFAPSSVEEIAAMFESALEITDGPVAIRWPRGSARQSTEVGSGLNARLARSGSHVCILAAGKMFDAAEKACDLLADEDIDATLWDPRLIKPLDRDMLRNAAEHSLVVTIEDGVRVGGFGSHVNDALQRRADVVPRVLQLGTPDEYLPHGEAAELHAELGLDPAGIAASIRKSLLRDAD
ncbi:MAG: 1-deoxy-D-xylulose-5-phosphate synthase [Actinomycetota bacterium]|jgi:1-deoxy-D-xylulose-5-phosphate synthase|nr:1-deoxy-D-xylulose-5-phosphate synthase [Actinomycetota bacterium]